MNSPPLFVPLALKRWPWTSWSVGDHSCVQTTTKFPLASRATEGLCWAALPVATTISLPTFRPEASSRWALMSLSLAVLTSVQTTTEEPLPEVADAAWCWTPGLVVLTRASTPERESRMRSSRASHCGFRPVPLGGAVLVPLRAHCRNDWRKNENMVARAPWRYRYPYFSRRRYTSQVFKNAKWVSDDEARFLSGFSKSVKSRAVFLGKCDSGVDVSQD